MDLLLTSWTEKGPCIEKVDLCCKSGPFLVKSGENNGPFICEGSSSKPTRRPLATGLHNFLLLSLCIQIYSNKIVMQLQAPGL